MKKLDSKYMNVKMVSEYTTLAVSTIYKFTSQNIIPYHKKGGKIIFIKDEIDEWILAGDRMSIELLDLPILKLKKYGDFPFRA